MENKDIAEHLNSFVASKYRWSATESAGKLIIRNSKGQVCGTVVISNDHIEIENVMAGRQNLMGALAKGEVRAFLQGLMRK